MIEIYDTGLSNFDRYIIIIDGAVYGMSHNPKSPQGFNQYIGALAELPMVRSNGERITMESLPEEVQEAIKEREVSSEKSTLILNVVTCGQCGEPFGHKMDVDVFGVVKSHLEELTCPYCGFNDDISSFPDLWHEDGKDSLFTLER